MELNFKNKVAIVTGASSGIGAETAKLMAEYNAQLTLVGRNEKRLEKIANECEFKSGLAPLTLILDLTHKGTCELIVNKTVETYGKIDILINCAGKIQVATLFDQTMEIFDELMNINFRVPYMLTQLALPHLIKSKGNVVNVGSSPCHRYRPGFMPFMLSKSNIEKFTSHAAAEIGTEGVRINAVHPGITKTNMVKNLNINEKMKPYIYRELEEITPQGTLIDPKEVALMICMTASDVFPSANGSNILLDGSQAMI